MDKQNFLNVKGYLVLLTLYNDKYHKENNGKNHGILARYYIYITFLTCCSNENNGKNNSYNH